MVPVRISYFSDVLCIWAYAAQARLAEIVDAFGAQVEIETYYCSVFPDAWGKIEQAWSERGGFEGFNRHLLDVAGSFPHIRVHDRLWLDAKPRTSASAHLFLKAVEVFEQDGGAAGKPPQYSPDRLSSRASWEMRRAFFEFGKDISDWQVHREVADGLGIDYQAIERRIRSSEAVAALAVDQKISEQNGVAGSPTFIMNDGRQKLFGNVGYKLIEANIRELLRAPAVDAASWC